MMKRPKKTESKDGQWDRAIVEAKDQLQELKIRCARLKAAIRVFEENKNKEDKK